MIVAFVDSWTIAAGVTDRLAQCGYVMETRSPDDAASLTDLPWTDVSAVFVAPELADRAELALDGLTHIGLDDTASVPAFVLTTLPTSTARHLGRHNGFGFRIIESPVMSGGVIGARTGTLSMSVAGPIRPDDVAFLRVTIAANTATMSDYGQPSTVKLLSNALMSIHARVLADVMVLAHEEGIDSQQFCGMLLHAAGASRAAEKFAIIDAAQLEKDARLAESSFPSLAETDTLFARLLREIDRLESHMEVARSLLETASNKGSEE